jgi:hypothetical protein
LSLAHRPLISSSFASIARLSHLRVPGIAGGILWLATHIEKHVGEIPQ